MLQITIPDSELFNEVTQEFIPVKAQVLHLEHSLVSISKWESKWEKPFLSQEKKSDIETRDYIKCMTLNQNVDPQVYLGITNKIIEQVNNYIEAKRSATWFGETGKQKGPSGRIITSELIYYWMVAQNIPFECQKWHLNRLLTLIQICNIENTPKKKINQKDLMKRNRNLNAARRQSMNTRG